MSIRKLDLEASWGEWIGHADCDRRGPDETYLIDNREHIEVLGEAEDEPNYDYNEAAVVRCKGHYYALTTSGCSCPSPSETWSVYLESHSFAMLADEVRKPKGTRLDGSVIQEDDVILRALAAAEEALKESRHGMALVK